MKTFARFGIKYEFLTNCEKESIAKKFYLPIVCSLISNVDSLNFRLGKQKVKVYFSPPLCPALFSFEAFSEPNVVWENSREMVSIILYQFESVLLELGTFTKKVLYFG